MCTPGGGPVTGCDGAGGCAWVGCVGGFECTGGCGGGGGIFANGEF